MEEEFDFRLTIDLIMIVGKYLEEAIDYINLIRLNKKFKDLLEMYKMNPISDWSIFPNIQTQHFYNRNDINNLNQNVFRYIAHPKVFTGLRYDNDELKDDYSFQSEYITYLTGKLRLFSFYVSLPKGSLFKFDNNLIQLDYNEFRKDFKEDGKRVNLPKYHKNFNHILINKDDGLRYDKSDQTISFPFDIFFNMIHIDAIFTDRFFSKNIDFKSLMIVFLEHINDAPRKMIFKDRQTFLDDIKNQFVKTKNCYDFREIERLLCKDCVYMNCYNGQDEMIHLKFSIPLFNGIESTTIRIGDYDYAMIGKTVILPPSFPTIVKDKLKNVINDYRVVYDTYNNDLCKYDNGFLFYKDDKNLVDIWNGGFIIIIESNNSLDNTYEIHVKGDDRINYCTEDNIVIQPEEKLLKDYIYINLDVSDDDDVQINNDIRYEWNLDSNELLRSEYFSYQDNELNLYFGYTSCCVYNDAIKRWCFTPDNYYTRTTYSIFSEIKPARIIVLKRINL